MRRGKAEQMDYSRKHIFLNGFMGVGKSRIGRSLAQRLNRPFVDTDTLIERRAGCAIREIFDKEGESGFREMERRVIAETAAGETPLVIAAGGGALVDDGSLALARQRGVVVFIRSAPPAIVERVKKNDKRPLLHLPAGQDYEKRLLSHITQMLEQRMPLYLRSHFLIDRDGLEAEDVAGLIVAYLEKMS